MNTWASNIVIFLILNLVISVCQAQTAFLKSADILEGDIAVLVVEFQNKVPSLFPLDTTPLQADFEVLQVRPSLRRKQSLENVVNIMHWEVELFPRSTGNLKIPPLNIKGEHTPALVLEVEPRNAQNDDGTKIYIETTGDHKSPYLGQQIIISVKLFHNRPLRRGILYDLKLDQAEIYPLGDDKRYRQIVDGESFTVLQRKLAIFAKKPGVLIIPAVEFRGELESSNDRRIKRTSSPLAINLLPPALEEYPGDEWLPASNLEVSQQWLHADRKLSIGDSISRKIVLRAKGLPASALPETLFLDSNNQFEVYADQAQRIDMFTDNGLIGELEQTHAIVFTGSGEISIPDIQLRWWDVDEGIEKSALLPGKNLGVAMPVEKPAEKAQILTNKPDSLSKLLWITAAIVSLLIIIIASRRFVTSNPEPGSFSRRKLKQACYYGDARTARNLLIAWASSQIPQQSIPGLYDLIKETKSATFKQQLKALDSAIYGRNQSPWQGQKLWCSFVNHSEQVAELAIEKSARLPDLYRV